MIDSRVSPANSAKRTTSVEQREAEERLDSIISVNGITTATQTTFVSISKDSIDYLVDSQSNYLLDKMRDE